MKQMNKEELIEYFIKQLGNNEILGKVMTIEQIRNKLNSIVEDVTYGLETEDNIAASWEANRKRLNFDMEKIPSSQEDQIIVHELLHVLSTNIIQEESNKFKAKVGLLYFTEETSGRQEETGKIEQVTGLNYLSMEEQENEEFDYIYNLALNEGMTDILTERITGKRIEDDYTDEKMIYRMISSIVGEDFTLKMYFSDDTVKNPSRIFEDIINQKYGEQSGKEINEHLRKALALLDDVNILNRDGLDEEGERLYSGLRTEMCDTLASLLEIVIDKEPYALNRNDLISIIKHYSEDDLQNQLLTNLINSDRLDYDKKMEILQYLNKGDTIGRNLSKNILDEASIFSAEEKLKIEASLGKMKARELKEKMYEQYVESGRITENDTIDKKEIFNVYTRIYSSNQEIDQYLQKLTYQKVGDCCIVNNYNKERNRKNL